MDELLEKLYYKHGEQNGEKYCSKELKRINVQMKNLKSMITKKQYRQVLRMSDDKDIIAHKMSVINFAKGIEFVLGLVNMINPDGKEE